MNNTFTTDHSDLRLYQAYAKASWLKYRKCRSPTRARRSTVSCSSVLQEWPSGRAIHILLIASAIQVSHVSPRDCSARTFVLTICRRRGDADGLSPAPTTATSDVQNSISTMDAAPSSTASRMSAAHHGTKDGELTLGVDLAKGITIDDAIPFPCTDRDATIHEASTVSGARHALIDAHLKSWLKLHDCSRDQRRVGGMRIRGLTRSSGCCLMGAIVTSASHGSGRRT